MRESSFRALWTFVFLISSGKWLPYAKSVIVEEFGVRAKVHIYYSPSKAVLEEESLYERIDKEEQSLMEMATAPPKAKRYDRHFKINRSKDGGFGFIRDQDKIKFVVASDGRKMLTPITKKQRDIFEACGFPTDNIPDWLNLSISAIDDFCIV